jgi:hypothetical protein
LTTIKRTIEAYKYNRDLFLRPDTLATKLDAAQTDTFDTAKPFTQQFPKASPFTYAFFFRNNILLMYKENKILVSVSGRGLTVHQKCTGTPKKKKKKRNLSTLYLVS